jgi:hypothetical protein
MTAPEYSISHLEDEVLVGLGELAGLVALEDDARAGHAQLVALAAHGLDEDAEVELAAAGDLELLGELGRGDRGRRWSGSRARGARRSCAR